MREALATKSGDAEELDRLRSELESQCRVAEEKEAIAQYGSADSGASLGDILGAALNKVRGGDKK